MLNKLNYVSSILNGFSLDIFGVLETWLLPTTPDSFVSIFGYGIVRTDTVGNIAKHGVCLFILEILFLMCTLFVIVPMCVWYF